MTTTKIRAAGLASLAALTGLVAAGTLVLTAPGAPAEQSGTATADQSSVASGSGTAQNDSVASGNAVATNGSVASGCSTAINESTASGACAPAPAPAAVTPAAPAAPAVAKVAKPTFAG